jgi:hypothetical protein
MLKNGFHDRYDVAPFKHIAKVVELPSCPAVIDNNRPPTNGPRPVILLNIGYHDFSWRVYKKGSC